MSVMKKYVLTVLLAVLMPSFASQKTDANAAGDAALLLQQILQFSQDLSMFGENWDRISILYSQAQSMFGTVSKYVQTGKTVNNIVSCGKKILTTGKDIASYCKYIASLDVDANLITHAYSNYTTFMYKTKNVITESKSIITLIGSFNNEDPLSSLSSISDVMDNAASQVEDASTVARNGIIQDYQKAISQLVSRQNIEFMKYVWP